MTAALAPGAAQAPGRVLRLGTRGSALAVAQSGHVADALRAKGSRVELVPVTTQGDTDPRSLASIGGTGVFAAALRTALLAGQVDLAVHSLKDLPVAQPVDLVVAAVPPREDPADVLVARDGLTLAQLPAGASVGTGSPRRAAQLRAVRPDLEVSDLRGNIDTRLGAVRSGRLDAVVLARAGLARLGVLAEVTETFGPELLLPAPGQGALAIECRAGDDLLEVLAALDDPASRRAVAAERAVLAGLGAGCSTPVAALALTGGDGRIELRASVGGTVHAHGEGTDPEALGRAVARDLLDAGADAYLGTPPTDQQIRHEEAMGTQ